MRASRENRVFSVLRCVLDVACVFQGMHNIRIADQTFTSFLRASCLEEMFFRTLRARHATPQASAGKLTLSAVFRTALVVLP